MPPVRSVTLRILGDGKEARAVLDWTNAAADKLDKSRPMLHIGADTSKAVGPLGVFRAEVARMTDKFYTFKFNASDSQLNAQLAGMMVKLAALQRLSDRWGAGVNVTNKSLGEASAKVLGLSAAYDALVVSQQKAVDTAHQAALDESHAAAIIQNVNFNKSTVAAVASLPNNANQGGGAGWVGALTTGKQSLFGGLASASTWHFAVDALAEIAAVAVPATVAILAFGAGLAATGPDLAMMYSRETAMYTATDILGQKMPGINTNINQLSQALKPGVFQVWGDAIGVVNQNSGVFAGLAKTAVGWVDKLAAAITVDLSHSGGVFRSLVTSGAHDLSILGGIITSVGGILGRLFQVAQTTHIAEDLLNIVAAIAKVADVILKIIPTPILATVVALHGLYLWGGKLVDIIPGASRLVGVFDSIAAKALNASTGLDFTVKGLRGVATDAEGATVKTGLFKTSLALLGQVPVWGWVALGAVALGGLVYWFSRGTDATTKWTQSLNTAIASTSNNQAFNLMAGDLGQVNTKLKDSVQASSQAAAGYRNTGSESRFASMQIIGANDAASASQQALGSEQRNLLDKMTSFSQGVGWIMTTFKVGYPEALAIANQAGVNLSSGIIGMSKAAQDARQQIIGLITGFAQLQTPAGVAGKDFEALAFASNDITSKISQLNSAWTTWEDTVTGSQTKFDAFAQGLNTMSSSAAVFTTRAGILAVKNIPLLKAGIDQLTPSGEALNQAFMQEAGNLTSLMGSMRSANASQQDQTATMKAGVAALIPYAAGSKEATSVLFALAQQADYTGNNSIKNLSSWAGIKAPDALAIMKKASDNATTAASNLANAIQNLLNVQFQNDVVQASGASAALKRYTTDLVNNRQTTQAGQADRQNLINDLIKAGVNAKQAAAYVDGLSASIHGVPANTNANVLMNGKGQYSITGISALVGNTGNNPGSNLLPTPTGHAAGWLVPGYGGGDKHPAWLEGGEAVVPKHLVPQIAPFLGSNHVPGFESGTYVGKMPGLTNFTVGMWNKFQNDMLTSMVSDLKGGIQQAANQFTSGNVPNVGSGVMRWAPLVLQALQMEGLGSYLASQVLYQMMTESGGNPNAINLSDSNAAAGDPSRGLLQTIGSTFSSYHWPGTSYNIYDPLANIAAAINYAHARYGPTLMSGGMGMGSGHGYALGGVVNEPVVGFGLRSGQSYSFGERGPEMVTPLSRVTPYGGGADGGGNIYVVVQAGDCVDPNAVAKAIHEKLRRYKTKKGGAPLGLS